MHRIERSQVVPITRKDSWEFFSSPRNLKTITPSYMGFDILEGGSGKMYAGQIIRYKVSPMLGIKLNWTTEITHVKEDEFFVDEQRLGPYSFWHHKHFFRSVDEGTEIIDIVHYKLPLGFLGRIVNALLVKRQLKEIFDYRHDKLKALFE